jgi:hypothetical protein
MSYIVHLPNIERIKKEAEHYRRKINADAIQEKEERKARIMEKFGRYMDAELRGNPKASISRRTNTIQ